MHRTHRLHAIHPCRQALTIVEALAAVALLALLVAVITPIATRAGANARSAALRLAARAAVVDAAIPTTATGERPVTSPEDCRLRWLSGECQVAGPTYGTSASGRWLRLQIVSGDGPTEIVLAERVVPLAVATP